MRPISSACGSHHGNCSASTRASGRCAFTVREYTSASVPLRGKRRPDSAWPSSCRTRSSRSAVSPASSTLSLGGRPSGSAYRRTSRHATEWNVPPTTWPRADTPARSSSPRVRVSSSRAARRVNVSSRIRSGATPSAISQATRPASVAVLPAPAPATTRRGRPAGAVAALRCASLRPVSQSSLSNICSSIRHRAGRRYPRSVATFALIHGGGGSAWDWHLVAPLLRERGHEAIAVDLPSEDETAGWSAYVDTVVRVVGGRTNVAVVGHSLGGFTAPLVCAPLDAGLLVLVAAMIPSPGELFADWWTNAGYEESGYDDVFYNGVPPALAAEAKRRSREEVSRALQEPWPLEAWPETP